MLNILMKSQNVLRMRYNGSTVLALSFALLVGVSPAKAQTEVCFRSRDLTPSTTWSMAPDGSTFKNGDIVGRTSAYTQFFMPIGHGETVHVDANGIPVSNAYNAVPLGGMPGLGLIVRWGGYNATVTLTPTAPSAAPGTIISNRTWFSVLKARATSNYTLTHFYTFELVVIDEKLYKGGKLNFVETGKTLVQTASQKGAGVPQLCYNGFVDPMAALLGTVQVPELPKPVTPTCRFTTNTLNQRVELEPVDPGQITPAGSARPTGSEGQSFFYVNATNCNKGAKIKLYFTDTRDTSTPKEYIRTNNPAVGIRLYYSGEYETMPFGPAPVGSWVPSRYAPTLGPATYEGGSLSAGFTAQYVRLPNKTEVDIKPGPVDASATLVIVYP